MGGVIGGVLRLEFGNLARHEDSHSEKICNILYVLLFRIFQIFSIQQCISILKESRK